MFFRVVCLLIYTCLAVVSCTDMSSMLQKLKSLDKEDTSNFTSSTTPGTQTNETKVNGLLDNLKALDTHHIEPSTINKTKTNVEEKAESETSNDSSSEKDGDSGETDSHEKNKRDLSLLDKYRKKNGDTNQKAKNNRVSELLQKARNQNQEPEGGKKSEEFGNVRKRSAPDDRSEFREFMELGHRQWRQRAGVRPLSWDSASEVRAKQRTRLCKTNQGGPMKRVYVGSADVKSRKTISRLALDAWMTADRDCDKCIRMSSTSLTKFGCAINMKCEVGPLVVCRYGK